MLGNDHVLVYLRLTCLVHFSIFIFFLLLELFLKSNYDYWNLPLLTLNSREQLANTEPLCVSTGWQCRLMILPRKLLLLLTDREENNFAVL